MERKYINENRYKKTAKSANRKRNVKVKKNIQKKNKSNKKKNYKSMNKFVGFVFCIILLLLIAVVARAFTVEENEPFIPVFFNNEVKENTDSINIAIYDSVSINDSNSVITELEQYIYPMLLRIGHNYDIDYEVVSSVNKVSNKEYELVINQEYGISDEDVKNAIEKIIKNKSKYYSKVENVDKIEIKSKNTLIIYLKSEDEYFIYNLNIPICINNSKYGIYSVDKSSNNNKLVLVRKESASKEYVKYINVIKLNSEEEAVEKYKLGSIDVFFSSSNSITKMLGKYEYDIKSYNSGEGIFLLFNKKSNVASEKYIRQIVAYGINRENILKGVTNISGKIVDLPYIYDEEKYKYDVYAADNIILSKGYKKQGLYYVKNGKKLTLSLLVNEKDEEKINIATSIKNDLVKLGINVNVQKMDSKSIDKSISTGNYDMVLANIYMNEIPNTKHIYESINMSPQINNQIELIKVSNVQDILDNINNLKTALSDDVAIYGIYSKQTYIIYRKGIDMFQDINYMHILYGYFNGKEEV